MAYFLHLIRWVQVQLMMTNPSTQILCTIPRLDTKRISSKHMSELRASYPCRSSGKESGDLMHDMFMIIINIMQSPCPH